jgi:hypothetical protein
MAGRYQRSGSRAPMSFIPIDLRRRHRIEGSMTAGLGGKKKRKGDLDGEERQRGRGYWPKSTSSVVVT